MPQELGKVLDNLEGIEKKIYGDLEIFSGIWKTSSFKEIYITTCWSGWGKVSAARATTSISRIQFKGKKIDFLFFTGVAGSAKDEFNQWDIVVADSVIQYDINAKPLFDKYIIPAINKSEIEPDDLLTNLVVKSLNYAKNQGLLKSFGSINKGLIGTADLFISDINILNSIIKDFPKLSAVEMEGGSFAQVAHQENLRWILLRVISDNANNSADQDFSAFIKEYEKNSWELVKSFLNYL